jgi:hypothetical protein
MNSEETAAEIERLLGEQSIEAIYRTKVLAGKTRRYDLRAPSRPDRVEVLFTLLGFELKINNRRLHCPDLATARYLSVFARIGCSSIAVPYDITQVAQIADELEASWHRMMLLVEHFTCGRSAKLRTMVLKRLLDDLRAKISEAGAGNRFPEFNKTRRSR